MKSTKNLRLWFLQRWLWCPLWWSPLGRWHRGDQGGIEVLGCRTSGRGLVFFLSVRRELMCRFTTLLEALLPIDKLSNWQPIPLRLFPLLFGLAYRLLLPCSNSSYRWEGCPHPNWVVKGRLHLNRKGRHWSLGKGFGRRFLLFQKLIFCGCRENLFAFLASPLNFIFVCSKILKRVVPLLHLAFSFTFSLFFFVSSQSVFLPGQGHHRNSHDLTHFIPMSLWHLFYLLHCIFIWSMRSTYLCFESIQVIFVGGILLLNFLKCFFFYGNGRNFYLFI